MSDATFDNIIASNATVNVKLLQMNYSEKISVIVPVYNTEKYLEASLRSVMNQTYKNLEIICVNDGSTDSSPAILQRLAAEDSRIRIINQDNAGQGAARNAGLAVATSEWITFPDSDDQLVPDAYETVVKSFELNPDMVHFSIEVVHENGAKTSKRDRRYYMLDRDGMQNITEEYILKADSSVSNKFFRKSVIDKYGIRFEEIRYEDFQFSREYMLVAGSVFKISRPLYIYLRRCGSTMDQTFSGASYSIDHLKAFQAVYGFMSKHCSAMLTRNLGSRFFVQYYNLARRYSDEATLPVVIRMAESIYEGDEILKEAVGRKIKHGTLTFYPKNFAHYVKLAIEFPFAIKYEAYDYKPFKIVRMFGITLMKRPATC